MSILSRPTNMVAREINTVALNYGSGWIIPHDRPGVGCGSFGIACVLNGGSDPMDRQIVNAARVILRVRPDQGIAGAAVDTSPAGPRFDITLRRLDEQRVEVCLQTSVVPRQGMTVVVNASSTGRLPIFELRYRPQARAAALYVDGRRVLAGYSGHHQFQDPSEGAVGWSVIRGDGMGDGASAAFNLVWFEIF